jgi:hypothetical protein
MAKTYNKNTFGIRPIHIRYISNISPDSSSILNRSMFYIPDANNEELSNKNEGQIGGKGKRAETTEYPYFTEDHDLDIEKLKKLSRRKLFDAFFTTIKHFKQYLKSTRHTSDESRSRCAESNFIGMLKLLLCTSFPKKDNISDTFSENIKQIASESHTTSTSVIDMVKNVFRNPSDKFCIITLGGTIYTLLSITYIDEFVNDMAFDKTFTIINEFTQWKNKKIETLEKELLDATNKFDALFPDKFNAIQSELATAKYDKVISSLIGYKGNTSIQKENLVPFLNEIRKTSNDRVKTEKALLNIAKNNELAKTIQYYIPYEISSIPNFMECVNTAFKKRVLQLQVNYFKDKFGELVAHMKKSKVKSENKVLEADEQTALDSIQNSPQIGSYLEAIKTISAPRRQYSNSILADAFSRTGTNKIEEISNLVIGLKSEDAPEAKYLNSPDIGFLKTGVMRVTETNTTSEKGESDIFGIDANRYYDACISLELMKGELNKDNLEEIKCSFKNSSLSNEYNKLQNATKENNPALLYIPTVVADIDMLIETKRKSNANNKQPIRNTNNNTRKKLRGGRSRQRGGFQLRPPTRKRKGKKPRTEPSATPSISTVTQPTDFSVVQ